MVKSKPRLNDLLICATALHTSQPYYSNKNHWPTKICYNAIRQHQISLSWTYPTLPFVQYLRHCQSVNGWVACRMRDEHQVCSQLIRDRSVSLIIFTNISIFGGIQIWFNSNYKQLSAIYLHKAWYLSWPIQHACLSDDQQLNYNKLKCNRIWIVSEIISIVREIVLVNCAPRPD